MIKECFVQSISVFWYGSLKYCSSSYGEKIPLPNAKYPNFLVNSIAIGIEISIVGKKAFYKKHRSYDMYPQYWFLCPVLGVHITMQGVLFLLPNHIYGYTLMGDSHTIIQLRFVTSILSTYIFSSLHTI